MSSSDSRHARDNSRARKPSNTDVRPESPLSSRSPRKRETRKKVGPPLSPKTPRALPDSKEAPKHPRRYSTHQQQSKPSVVQVEEVIRPTDKIIRVDLEEIEREVRGRTPPSALSLAPTDDPSMLNYSVASDDGRGPKTSTPKKSSSSRKHRRQPEPLLKQVLKKSTSRSRNARAPSDRSQSSIDDSRLYHTAQESFGSSSGPRISPILVEETGAYRSPNSTQRALFSRQGTAPVERPTRASRSSSRSRRSPPAVAPSCKLVTPLAVHTAQEVNAISATGQILFISQTLVRSAHASDNVRRLINKLSEYTPIISNEYAQTDIDHDNEHSKHEVFVGADAILIQRISTIHRGRDRNSFETDDRRTYRFVCEGDLLPEDRRDKLTKPRHLTIVAESSTAKFSEEIEKSERVVLIFDAADQPSRVLAPMPAETSLTHANQDIVSKPSGFKDSPVAFDEHVRVSDHSHINVVRKARVLCTPTLWDEPITELKEQRVYTQQLADDAECEPVRITRSHSLSRNPTRAGRSPSASRRRQPEQPSTSRLERSRSNGRPEHQSSGPVKRPVLQMSGGSPSPKRDCRRPSLERRPDITPSAPLPTDVLTAISPIKDEPARRETRLLNSTFDQDDTNRDSVSLPARNTSSGSPVPKTLHHPNTLRRSPTSRQLQPLQQEQPQPDQSQQLQLQHKSPRQHKSPVQRSQRPAPRTPRRDPSPASRTEQQQQPMIIDEDTSAGSSQSPTQNRTPTTVSPRHSRLVCRVYQSPDYRTHASSRDSSMDEWERMLDTTQPISPTAASIADRIPSDLIPAASAAAAAPAASDSRLARASRLRGPPSVRSSSIGRRGAGQPGARPLGAAKSCMNLDASHPTPSSSSSSQPARRARSEHSIFVDPTAPGAPAVPANSAVALSAPFRRQLYVSDTAAAPSTAAPVPRPRTSIKRKSGDGAPVVSSSIVKKPRHSESPCATARTHSTVKKRPVTPRPHGAMTVTSMGATAAKMAPRQPASAVRQLDFTTAAPTIDKDKQVQAQEESSGGSSNGLKNVELVSNPHDYDEGEILIKKMTLEAKINGHMWIMSVNFALRSEHANLIRFQPKRVRIDDQTLWEETENWSQTSLTPVTGPRTVARGSTSYDQLAPVSITPNSLPKTALPTTPSSGNSSNASTQTPSPMNQTVIRVMPKSPALTASTARSSNSKKSADKSKKSGESSKNNSKRSAEKKKKNNTPHFI